MRKFFIVIICIAAFSSCKNEVDLAGKEGIKEFLEDNFSGIGVQNGFEIYLEKGTESKIKIEADEKIIPLVKHEIKDGILYFFKDSKKEFPSNTLVKILITKDSLQILKAANSKIFISDTLQTGDFELNLSNSSVLDGRIECRQLKSTVNSSTVKLTGTAEYVQMDILGGSLIAPCIETENAKLNIAGGSIVNMNVSNELEIYARDKSHFYYDTIGVLRSMVLDDNSKMILGIKR